MWGRGRKTGGKTGTYDGKDVGGKTVCEQSGENHELTFHTGTRRAAVLEKGGWKGRININTD